MRLGDHLSAVVAGGAVITSAVFTYEALSLLFHWFSENLPAEIGSLLMKGAILLIVAYLVGILVLDIVSQIAGDTQ